MPNGKDIMYLKHQVPKPYIRIATENDCWFLSKNLRKEDYQEIKASTGLPAILCLLAGLKISQVPLVVCNEKGKIILMFRQWRIPN